MGMITKRMGRLLSICLVLLMMPGCIAEASGSTVEFSAEGLKTYKLFCEYVDQGDVKTAVNALLEGHSSDEVYAHLSIEDSELLKTILVEAACFYNEDGDLFNLVDLRLKGFFTDEMFLRYWELVGTSGSIAITDDANQSNYDAYLFCEIMNWYLRGGDAIVDIVDLRYLGMIDDVLYSALVEEWKVDLMDSVDIETYIPLYGMKLSEAEKEQIRILQTHVDEGESQRVAEMFLNGDITEKVYCWLRKSNAKLIDMILAQAMYEFATDGSYEQNMRLILGGFVFDACFERYWNLLEIIPTWNERKRENYPGVDMYFVYEVERICMHESNDSALLQWLRDENLIDEYTYDLLFDRVGGWEKETLETKND